MNDIPDFRDLPGFKRKDIQKCICGKGVMEGQTIAFYICDLRYCMIDVSAVRQEAGLEMMMGGHAAIAAALSPDPDIAKEFSHYRVWLCLECSMTKSVGEIAEMVSESEE